MTSVNKRPGFNDPPRKLSYHIVKFFFTYMSKAFYNDIEVEGRRNFPKEGPVLLAINHVNSLTDSVIVIGSQERNVRMTCKDTLLVGNTYGLWTRSCECIGIKRRMDYNGNKVDNTLAMDTLMSELENGAVVAMFPEGIGRYKSNLSNLRSGLARCSVNYVLNMYKNPGKYNSITILPIGLSYLHREMFRSSVCIRIGEGIKVDINLLKSLGLNNLLNCTNDEIYLVSKKITSKMESSLKNLVISSPTWHQICLSHLTRQIGFVDSSSPRKGSYLSNYIDLTRQIDNVYTNYINKDTNVKNTYNNVSKYWNLLYKYNIKDYRIHKLSYYVNNNKYYKYKASLISKLMLRSICGLILFPFTLPCVVFTSPISILWRLINYNKIKKGPYKNFDGIAQAKIFSIFLFIMPVQTLNVIWSSVFYILLKRYKSNINFKLRCKYSGIFSLIFPSLIWLGLRFGEEYISNIRSCLSLIKLLFLNWNKCKELVNIRNNLYYNINKIILNYNICINNNIMNDKIDIINSTVYKNKNSFWLWRILWRRNKSDWNETLRIKDISTDRFHHFDNKYYNYVKSMTKSQIDS